MVSDIVLGDLLGSEVASDVKDTVVNTVDDASVVIMSIVDVLVPSVLMKLVSDVTSVVIIVDAVDDCVVLGTYKSERVEIRELVRKVVCVVNGLDIGGRKFRHFGGAEYSRRPEMNKYRIGGILGGSRL